MEITVVDRSNKKVGKIKMPKIFSEPVRQDLIARASRVVQSTSRQPYGSSPLAGKRQSVRVSKRRRDWRGSYGIGISRIPRKVMLRRGTRFNWTGAFIPSAVGGRRAHPPKAEKIWAQKINKKEKRKSLRSAIAATVQLQLVKVKHLVPAEFPFILSEDFEQLDKTKDVRAALKAIGLADEMVRVDGRKIRAGKGKSRGRKYRTKKGPLIIVSKDCSLAKAARNIEGLDIVEVAHVNVTHLAPGAVPGRLTLWSKPAIELIEKKQLFT